MKTGPYSVRLPKDSLNTEKKCNWCHKEFVEDRAKVAEQKPYCPICQKSCVRECLRCQKPYPHLRLFNKSEKKCDSCMATVENSKHSKKRFQEMVRQEMEEEDMGSSGGSSPEYGSEDEEQKPVEQKVSTTNATEDKPSREQVQIEQQKKMDELMRALTEHQRGSKKRAVEGKPKRKYAKRETKGQEKLYDIELDFLKAFLELKKIDRGSSVKPPFNTALSIHLLN